MEKTATLNLRVNPVVKQEAEEVLNELGVPMTTAVNMFLRQVSLTHSIPFPVALPGGPARLDIGRMTSEELRAAIQTGLDALAAGKVRSAAEAFEDIRREHSAHETL